MLESENIKVIQGLSYYTGSHSKLKLLNKKNSRPSEFGHKVWATSLVFIDFLAETDFKLNNKSVLEIGCGWGILGLYLAKNFNCSVTCTDLDERVLPIVKVHADLNSVKVKTEAKSFNQISDQDLRKNEVIVGVEVCYSEQAAAELNKLISRAFNFGVKQIFIVDPGRPDFLDIICKTKVSYKNRIYSLPGTKNGKVTNLLHLFMTDEKS